MKLCRNSRGLGGLGTRIIDATAGGGSMNPVRGLKGSIRERKRESGLYLLKYLSTVGTSTLPKYLAEYLLNQGNQPPGTGYRGLMDRGIEGSRYIYIPTYLPTYLPLYVAEQSGAEGKRKEGRRVLPK